MKRSHARALVAGAGIVSLATAAVTPALSHASSAPARQVLTFQEPRPRLDEDDVAPKSKARLSIGDRLAIGGTLENAARHRVGTFGGTCTAVGSGLFGATPLTCQAVYQLAGGQIEAMGAMTLGHTDLAIVGGTGAYAGVHGSVTPGHREKGFDDADQLTIER